MRAVGNIALAIPDVNGIVERMLLFLESGSEHIVAETLVQMKDLLRRYPDMALMCMASVEELQQGEIGDPEAKAALVWILGAFGGHLGSAPYALEALLEGFPGEEPAVRLAALTAAVQLFFQRPPECQKLLGAVLAAGVNDANQDVRDRALLYYRCGGQPRGHHRCHVVSSPNV